MAQEEENTIKSAVNQPADEEMQESLMTRDNQPQTPPPPMEQDNQNYQGYDPYAQSEAYPQQYAQDNSGYPAPQSGYEQQYSGPSTDTITEISEQIVSEKISELKKDLEKVLEFKGALDSKIDFIDQRLKRIENTIDKLQLSILQKVGEYVNNVQDLKSEVIETQKSFKSLLDKKSA